MIVDNDIYEFIRNFTALKKKNSSLLHYNLNLIDELHANENAHTRILLKLLDYEFNQKKVILEDFLNLLNRKLLDRKIPIFDDYKITGQFEFIDGYIWSDSKKVAIIIENKINWACDQNEQIQRYIETAKQCGIDEKDFFVVYLTDNGIKKAADYSFTDYAKKMLDWKDPENQGRYIESNYLYDILPFLYEIFNKLSFSKENVLKAAIFQYIDYLEGRFGMRKNEKEYNIAMNESLIEVLNLSGTEKEKFDQIEQLQQELWRRLDDLKYEIYPNQPNHIANQLKDFLYQNPDSAPFEVSGIYQGTCVLSRAWSLPLSSNKDKYFAVDIGINSDEEFSFNIHIIKGKGEWVDADTFKSILIKHSSLFDYLENNKKIKKFEESYERREKYNGITELQEKILKQFTEIKKYLA